MLFWRTIVSAFSQLALAGLTWPFVIVALYCLGGCDQRVGAGRSGSPMDQLPAWITPLVSPGLRPDWSPDGRHIVFLDALVGDAHEIDLETGITRSLTGDFQHRGFTRVRYLANGDFLLCGPGDDSKSASESGRWHTELWYLPHSADTPAQALNEPCFEGPAVSRQDLKIAWTRSDYPEQILFARSEIWMARVLIDNGQARLAQREKLLDRSDFNYLAFLETQDFRPPTDSELLFTAYAYRGGEVMGIDLASGKLTNYSLDWAYDEAEGVFPDGRTIATERELGTYSAVPEGDIDIWQLRLDGSGQSRRLTWFSQFPGYGANNPVISPDGRTMAFGLRIKGEGHGNASGILLYHLDRAPESQTP